MNEHHIVCTLTDSERNARRDELLLGLVAEAKEETQLPDGFRWTFGPEALQSIFEAIEVERRCCRFLGFTLTVASQTGCLTLDVTGPPGTVEFLATMIERDQRDRSRVDPSDGGGLRDR